MKKNASLLLVFTLLSSAIFSTLGCQFTFNDQEKVNSIANNKFAEQAAKVVEGFFFAHKRKADTGQTINDMLGEVDNLGIANSNIGPINNMADFKKYWGENDNITIAGFSESENNLIVPHQTGELTKKINDYKKQNNNLSDVDNYLSLIPIIDNKLLKSKIEPLIRKINDYLKKLQQLTFNDINVLDFLDAIKKLSATNIEDIKIFLKRKNKLEQHKEATDILDGLKQIKNYHQIKLLSELFNSIANDANQKEEQELFIFLTTIHQLNDKLLAADSAYRAETIMVNLPFWIKLKNWLRLTKNTLIGPSWDKNPDGSYFKTNVTDLLTNTLKYFFHGKIPPLNSDIITNYEYNGDQKYAYAGGHILNRLFARISEDNKLKKDKNAQFVKRDLSGIINDITDKDFEFPSFKPKKRLLSDFQQYSEKILQNPSYMIELVAAFTPLIKHLMLNNANNNSNTPISTKIQNLTLADDDFKNNTYSITTLLKNLQSWFSGELASLQTLLVNIIKKDPKVGSLQFFLAPILDKLDKSKKPLILFVSSQIVQKLIDWLKTILVEQLQQIITKAVKIIATLSDESKKTKIDIFKLLEQLNSEQQLLPILNNIAADLAKTIINKNTKIEAWYFYELLGGDVVNQETIKFRENSLLSFIKSAFTKSKPTKMVLSDIISLLLGNSTTSTKRLIQVWIDDNNQSIDDKYKKYFSAKNKVISKVYHVQHHAKITADLTIDYWQFYLNYTIDEETFYFKISCNSKYDSKNNPGLRIVKFTEITKLEKI